MNEKKINFEGIDSLKSENLEKTYPLKEIRIDKGRMSIFELKRRHDDKARGDIILNPDFQRTDKIWTLQQKSELIESIIMGIPLPVIYFFQDEKGYKQVVDGRQRLTCIFTFLNNEFKLQKLNIFSDLNGKYFKDLDSYLQNKIEDYQLEIYTILPPAPERVKFNLFDRLNRGGTQLNNQEIRNALYQGTSTKLIKEMSELDNFKVATGNHLNSERMIDRYLILRFISFYLLRKNKLNGIEYTGEIDEFLKNTMEYINTKKIEEYKELKDKFDTIMGIISKNYDDNVFRFKNKKNSSRKRPINMALFECITYMFILALDQNITIDSNELEEFKSTEFDKPERFTYGIDSKENVKFRFDSVENFLLRS